MIHIFYHAVLAYDRLPVTVLIEYLLCAFISFFVIALYRRMLGELFFSALDLDLLFVISQRLLTLVDA